MNDLNIEALSAFLESTDHDCMIEISDCIAWCVSGDEVHWISWNGGDQDCLEYYAAEIRWQKTEHEEHCIFNLDSNCGYTTTSIFSKHNKLSVDDFYDKYEDCM